LHKQGRSLTVQATETRRISPTVCVLHRNKQGLCVPKSQSKAADFLAALLFGGLLPPTPPKKRMKEGIMYMKDIRIAVRVTAKEKDKIKSKARKCGLSTTEYVKQRALGYEPRGIPPDALFLCLEKLGELADKASTPELDKEIGDVLKEITAEFLLPGKGCLTGAPQSLLCGEKEHPRNDEVSPLAAETMNGV
jgi:hypothetical protein